jgi:site-specific DNA-cytosine methylase
MTYTMGSLFAGIGGFDAYAKHWRLHETRIR